MYKMYLLTQVSSVLSLKIKRVAELFESTASPKTSSKLSETRFYSVFHQIGIKLAYWAPLVRIYLSCRYKIC